ncbi:hypothetical protein BCR33DRAFT_722545 [Rhizoclosmatium globosum]|uniref:Autophagy-related protein n=1 Tax=Rhizoclosmatium globosum TaxID=329046 RepID=A0A1Y2BK86_9FUNG|nr:hypothetical protein BCR33DRAFT_722545 [Rhizoclosmatium globosum]|eukprot:ORY35196.1 hypothetical protein BCR33DRAFT_722545 [Rhizoclosmatium globosum]
MAIDKTIGGGQPVEDDDYNPDAVADPTKYMRTVAVVSLYELWSYYLFYNGDNGGGPNGQFASLVPAMINKHANANWIAYNATLKPEDAYPEDAPVIPQVAFSLLQTALTQFFAAVVLITLGGLGDYKLYGRTFLFWSTVVSIALHFAFVFINVNSGQWILAVILLMICQISYQMTLSFFFAAFPRLARHMPTVYEKIDAGCTVREVEEEIAIQRGRISMISTYWSNIGWAVPLLIFTGVIFALNPDPDANQVDFTFNANALLFGIYWLVFAIPYFILDKKRPGPDIPEGVNVYTQGIVQAREALKLAKYLPQAWWYIVGYFLFVDGLNSSGVIMGNYIQPNFINFNVLKSNLFSLGQALASMLGCLVFWKAQIWFKLETKTMLQISNILMMLTYAWGIIGLFSKTVGYRSYPEFWVYNLGAGFWGAPFWALMNTYLAELIPTKKAYLFFGLFGIMTKCSAFVGPLVNFIITSVSRAQDADYIGFVPCTILSLIGFIIMQRTDPVKGRLDVIAYEQKEAEFEAQQKAQKATSA